jgi:hypothetical protein
MVFEVMTLLVETHFLRQVLQGSPLLLEFLGTLREHTGDIWGHLETYANYEWRGDSDTL